MQPIPRVIDPRDHDPAALECWARHWNADVGCIPRLLAAVIGRDERDPVRWSSSCRVPKRMLASIEPLPRLRLERSVISPVDGFQKLLFRTRDHLPVETVLIPLHRPGRVSVCVSSQVGCPIGCQFCATARMPTRRNLATWEIVDQLTQARQVTREQGRQVTGAVFMGMGEPFLNYERVLAAAELFRYPYDGAIAGKAITISTVGLVPQIDRFTQENRRFRLSISLIAADEATRSLLVPNHRTPLRAIIAAARRHAVARRERIMLVYVCIRDVNVGIRDAQALAALVGDIPVRLDLIDVSDPTGRFQPPGPLELGQFRDALTRNLGQPVARRYSGGLDIRAACGTLAGGQDTPVQ